MSQTKTRDIEQEREEVLAVRMESGSVVLLEDMQIIQGGVIEGREPDGEAIYLRKWRKVTTPTVGQLRHMTHDLPARQKRMLRGGDQDEHRPATIE